MRCGDKRVKKKERGGVKREAGEKLPKYRKPAGRWLHQQRASESTFDQDCESDIVPKLNLCPPKNLKLLWNATRWKRWEMVLPLGDQTGDHP